MKLVKWLSIRSLDSLTFTVKRLTGIALTIYFLIHLADITIIVFNKQYYETLLSLSQTPLGLLVDSLIWTTLIFHASTSLYSFLIGLGFFLGNRRKLLLASWTIALVTSTVGVVALCL